MRVLKHGWVKDVEISWLFEPLDWWVGGYGPVKKIAFSPIIAPPIPDGKALYLIVIPCLPLKLRWGHQRAKTRRCRFNDTHKLAVNDRGVSGPCATCGVW